MQISVPSTRVYAMKPNHKLLARVDREHFSTLDSGLRDETKAAKYKAELERMLFQYPRLGSTR